MNSDAQTCPWYRRLERGLRRLWKLVLPSRSGPRVRTVRVVQVPLANPAPPLEPFAIMVHAFYPDVFQEIAVLLQQVSLPFHLFITTDTEEKRRSIQVILNETKLTSRSEIRLFPNRGRDIAPKWVGLADVYQKYPVFLHLHTKKSLFDPELGSAWRRYLYQSLIGSEQIVASNLEILSRRGVGIVYPHYFTSLTVHGKWGSNFESTQTLLARMDIKIAKADFDFPAGSMYWARSQALQPLLDLNLSLDDFREETGHIDGGMEHAMERSILFVARKEGYHGVPVIPAGQKIAGYRFIDWSN